jgi:hypothetical protein
MALVFFLFPGKDAEAELHEKFLAEDQAAAEGGSA